MKHIKRVITHPLISGSSIIFVTSFIANVLGYLFNLSMGRVLSVSDYGLLISLTSTFIFFTIIQTSLIGIFAKFAAKFHANKNEEYYAALLHNGMRFVSILALLVLIVLFALIPFLSWYLHVKDIRLLLFIPLLIAGSIIYALPTGIMQGKLMVVTSGIINVIGPLLKIVLSLLFIFLGFKLFGVLFGILLSVLIPLVISLFIILQKEKKKEKVTTMPFWKEFRVYGMQYFLASLGITIMTNMDVILTRHFLGAVEAGQYAALSLMGKAIFYFTSPIYFIFFPLIAQKKEKSESLTETLSLAGFIIFAVSSLLALFYFLFPQIVLRVFFPAKTYAILSQYLGFYALYILVFSIASLFNNFLLSVGKGNVYRITLSCGILYVGMTYFFHANLYQIIFSLFSISVVMLLLLIIYYFKYGKK